MEMKKFTRVDKKKKNNKRLVRFYEMFHIPALSNLLSYTTFSTTPYFERYWAIFNVTSSN